MLIMKLMRTDCIRIVANCETRFFQVTNNFYEGYIVHVYYYIGYYFYTLLPTEYSLNPMSLFSCILHGTQFPE